MKIDVGYKIITGVWDRPEYTYDLRDAIEAINKGYEVQTFADIDVDDLQRELD